MKDRKLSLLVGLSIVLFTLSICLMGLWVHNYLQNQKAAATTAPDGKAVNKSIQQITKDSLAKAYATVITRLDTSSSLAKRLPDSLQQERVVQLQKLYKVRDEISALLDSGSSPSDLENARLKITQLEFEVNTLQSKTKETELENKRLALALNQLKSQLKNGVPTSKPPVTQAPANKTKPEVLTSLIIADLRLWASDEAGKETTAAQAAHKIQGSFFIKNLPGQLPSTELYVVITQPDGTVLKQSDWESGAFSSSEGRKYYTSKLIVDAATLENKRLSFSITAGPFQKGVYTSLIYQNGNRIGKSTVSFL